MNIDLKHAALRLSKGTSVRVREGAGRIVRVLEGSVWITEEDNPRDVVLYPGQNFRLSHRGLVIVEAFSDASISLALN